MLKVGSGLGGDVGSAGVNGGGKRSRLRKGEAKMVVVASVPQMQWSKLIILT